MCAIAGVLSSQNSDYSQFVNQMCEKMLLRGPDYHAIYNEAYVTLGHSRLSIIDLSTGNQPMRSSDGNVVIVFNGEIYNFRELKRELQDVGYEFVSNSDTEVIIAGYQILGIDVIIDKLEGMFAFAIFDRITKNTFIARDKYGEKPLYYEIRDKEFIFASELKAFSPSLKKYTLDKKALNFYLALNYIPSPYSLYKEIRKVPQGHYFQIDSELNIQDVCYYNLSERIQKPINDSYEKAAGYLKELIYDSIQKRMIADVPTGAFLSGGIDSSIVCSIMSELSEDLFNTFSLGFKEKEYDESGRAKIVSDKIGSEHNLHILDFNDVAEAIDDIIDYYDEPFADSSAIPSYYVAKLARKKVKVVLTGDSADEIFAGYEKYLGRYYVDYYRKLPILGQQLLRWLADKCPVNHYTNVGLRKLKKLIYTAELSDFDIYYNLMCLGNPDKKRSMLLKKNFYVDIKSEIKSVYDSCPSESYLNREQFCDVKYVLEGCMFPKVDRACMHNSLENRTPFIDSRIVEYAFRMNPEYKLKGKNKKRILKDTFGYLLPKQTKKFSKKGFGVPVGYWLRNELCNSLYSFVDKEFLEEQGIFEYDYIKQLCDNHLSCKEYNDTQLWNFYVFQKWYEKHS